MSCIHHQILDKVVFGYAHHKIILDEYGRPLDYQFIEVNQAFLNLAGLSGKQVEGKKVSEVIHGFTKNEAHWIQYFGNIALNQLEDEYDYFSEALNKWFRVQVFSSEKEFFSMIFFDVTQEKFLFDTIKKSFGDDTLKMDYQQLCEDMKDISGARYVVMNIMDFIGKSFQTVAVAGMQKEIKKATDFLGFQPIGKKWDHDQDRFENLHARTITKYESLMQLTNQSLDTKLQNKLVKVFGVGQVYLVSIKKDEKVLGDFTLIMKSGEKLKNEKLIELKTWQAALQLDYYRTRQMLNQLFEVSPDLIAVTDTSGHFLRINEAWQDFLGKEQDALIGRNFLEFIHPDDMAETQKAMKKLEDEAKLSGFVNRYIDKNNKYRYLEWRATYYEKLVYAAARDITENIEARRKLQEKSDFQEILMNVALKNINVPLDQVNETIQSSLREMALFAKADRAYIFDYLWEEEITRNTFEWCHEDISPQINNLQNVPLSMLPDWVNTHKKGESMNIPDVCELEKDSGLQQILEPQGIKSLLTIPLMEHGECVGFVGFDWVRQHYMPSENQQVLLQSFTQMLVNIKERTRLEQSLVREKENAQKADKLKTAFLNNISHEVRTPLNGILGFAELLADQDHTPEEAQDYLKMMETNSYRLIKTMSDYIDMSEITSGNVSQTDDAFFPDELLESVAEDYKSEIDQEKVQIETELPADAVQIITDRELMLKIFTQLLDNAVKFTKSGVIRMGYYLSQGQFYGFVEDTGIGIKNEMQEKIFDVFAQEDSSNTRLYEGSGIGLSIVKGLIRVLDGNIELFSVKDKGTRVTFHFPVQQSEPSAPEKPDAFPIRKTGKILIAEDDWTHQMYLKNILKRKNFSVALAGNGREAIDLCKSDKGIRMVLMDIKMPDVDGLEATRTIKENCPDLPVVAVTAYVMQEDEHKALAAGCDAYLSKPLSKKTLDKILRRYGLEG